MGFRVFVAVANQFAELHAGDFNLEAAEVGMQIFANAVSDIDARALCRVPSSADRAAMSQPTARDRSSTLILRQLEAEVALFHDARCEIDT